MIDRTKETYEEYLERYNQAPQKEGMPGYDPHTYKIPMTRAYFYYYQSGQFGKDLQMLEKTRSPSGFNREDFERLCDEWWKYSEVNYKEDVT